MLGQRMKIFKDKISDLAEENRELHRQISAGDARRHREKEKNSSLAADGLKDIIREEREIMMELHMVGSL
jgi:hypothetical protein